MVQHHLTLRMAQTIVDQQNGALAFRLDHFEDLSQFDHLQRKKYYTVILLREGSLKLVADFSEYELEGSHIICLSPYQPYMLTSANKCAGVILNFHPDFFCTYRHQNEIETEGILFHNFNQPPFFQTTHQEIFHNLLNQMSSEMDRKSIAQHEVLVAYLKVFLIESVRQKKQFDKDNMPKTSDRQSEVIQHLIDTIERNFCSMHSPQDYADILYINTKTLAGIVKKHLHQTPTALITNRIIIEAKRELYLTSKSVKQISAVLGYQDEFYFSRLFKKKVGVSPDNYRKTVGYAKLEKKN